MTAYARKAALRSALFGASVLAAIAIAVGVPGVLADAEHRVVPPATTAPRTTTTEVIP